MSFLLYLLACTPQPKNQIQLAPESIGSAECDVCGMLVQEQPSPRGQLVYADGTHAFTCSLHGLHLMARAPTPRGKPLAIYVEALSPSFDWSQMSTEPLKWISADQAHFVAGAVRHLVMGPPLLSYADAQAAESAADRLGVRPLRWQKLFETDDLSDLTKTNLE